MTLKKLAVYLLVASLGLVTGGLAVGVLQTPAAAPRLEPAPPAAPGGTGEQAPPSPETIRIGDEQLLLVWTAGGLDDTLDDDLSSLGSVEHVTVVAGDVARLAGSRRAGGAPVDQPGDGWSIPLDALAIDPGAYAATQPKADHLTISRLAPGQALLSETSAQLRQLTAGDVLTFDGGTTLTVGGVIDDVVAAGAEVIVHQRDGESIGVTTPRFALVMHTGDRAALEQRIRQIVDGDVRVRAPGETPFLRHGDAVLTKAQIKATFGEFAHQHTPGSQAIRQDLAWVAEHIVDADVPIIGRVRCHRGIVTQLTGAMTELADRGLEHLVDPDQYAGCHTSRLIAPDAAISHHAWGIAVDINADDNPYGQPSAQDPRLVETMQRWGFTWGGFWLVPDAMHFEYIGPPELDAAKIVPQVR